ncbi:MAG: tetratricopeptide repeat protein [Bacteroides sp.]|nr:tetratricopeptide repeat protein [Bacteroides sp.]
MIKKTTAFLLWLTLFPLWLSAQINTDRVMMIARNALYFEDYVLSIQYFNQVINAKPYLYEPYFFRALAKINLDDFQGAESDCDAAIDRNPFVVGAYQIRGLARIRQSKFDEAIEDYKKALEYAPENITLWHNLVLCQMQKKDYEGAGESLESLLTISPRYTRGYLMRGEVALRQQDTIRALADFDRAIEMDRYDADGWASRAMVSLSQKKYKEAEEDLDQAIRLSARNAGNYINRALARFHQNNLRGAMSDYDLALDIDPYNYIGHYNRGLLRAEVGDDNRAIEDFDFVLEVEPDNMLATFNRGMLRAQTGDYRGAISDYSRVIEEYPNFLAGYYHRAEARRNIGDRRGAQEDENTILSIQIDQHNASYGFGNTTNVAEHTGGDGEEGAEEEKTRKRSDRNMANYRKIVIADDGEADKRYDSDYRGKVQDRNVAIRMEPMYTLTYYEKVSEVRGTVHYHKFIDDLNRSGALPLRLRITNMESPLTEQQVNTHFSLIDTHTATIVEHPANALARFMRAMDFYLVQDFASALEDLTQATLLDGTFYPPYFMRALTRYKQLEYEKSEDALLNPLPGSTAPARQEVGVHDYDMVRRDLDRVIELAPDFVYAYYNRANLLAMLNDYRAALLDYDEAIRINPEIPEFYFNRGLTHIFLGNNRQGINDLSKAGELGVVSAYNIIKRFTEQPE